MTTTTKPETKKLCKHVLTTGCKFGASCASSHPVDLAKAREEQTKKKTLNICGFYPSCANPACTYLHIDVYPPASAPAPAPYAPAPYATAPALHATAPAPHAPATLAPHAPAALAPYPQFQPHPAAPARRGGRHAPQAPTPAKPAAAPKGGRGRAAGQKTRGGRAPRRDAKPARKEDSIPSLCLLHKIRGKVLALNKAAEGYAAVAGSVKGPLADQARAKVEHEKHLQAVILQGLESFATQIQQYLDEFGGLDETEGTPPASQSDDASDDESEEDPAPGEASQDPSTSENVAAPVTAAATADS